MQFVRIKYNCPLNTPDAFNSCITKLPLPSIRPQEAARESAGNGARVYPEITTRVTRLSQRSALGRASSWSLSSLNERGYNACTRDAAAYGVRACTHASRLDRGSLEETEVTECGGVRVTSRPARGHRVWEQAAGASESQPESRAGREKGGGGSRERRIPGRGSGQEVRIEGDEGRWDGMNPLHLPPPPPRPRPHHPPCHSHRPVRRGREAKSRIPHRMPPRSARTPCTRRACVSRV